MSRTNYEVAEALRSLELASSVVLDGDKVGVELLSDFLQHDRGYADAYVKASSTEDIAKVVRYAFEHSCKVTVRGAGTNLVGSTVPHGGIVIDVSGLNRIIDLDINNRTVLVEAGVLLENLQNVVEQRGLFYPPDPAEKHSTIGGNVSTNAGGMRAVKYGVTRDYVLGLEVVTPTGEILSLGSKCLKDTTGLPLKQLFIGAEGSLGIITKCQLRLIDKPQAVAHALIGFDSLSEAVAAVAEIQRSGIAPTAIEFIERKVITLGNQIKDIDLCIPDCEALLLVTFDGDRFDLPEKLKCCHQVLRLSHTLSFQELKDEKAFNKLHQARWYLAKALQCSTIWEPLDAIIPVSHIPEFLDFVETISSQFNVSILSCGHAGNGNVQLCILKDTIDDLTWQQHRKLILNKLYSKLHELDGKVSSEYCKSSHHHSQTDEAAADDSASQDCQTPSPEALLLQAIKQSFDPKGIFS